MTIIEDITAREILDSRGSPTIEVAASQPAIEGAQSAGRPWITLYGATKT